MPMCSCATSSTGCRWWPTGRPTACRRMPRGWRASPPSWASPMPRPSAPRSSAHMAQGRTPLWADVRSRADARRRGRQWQPGLHRRGGRPGDHRDAARPWAIANPSGVAALVRGWHHGHTRATRSERARELLTALMPALLAAFAKQRDPDAAIARLDGVLGRLAAGVQVLSLLRAQSRRCSTASRACWARRRSWRDHLARHTAALEGLLMGVGRPERQRGRHAARPAARGASPRGSDGGRPPPGAGGQVRDRRRHAGRHARCRCGRRGAQRAGRCRDVLPAAACHRRLRGAARQGQGGCARRSWRWASSAGGRCCRDRTST